jgi:hypothetical protein
LHTIGLPVTVTPCAPFGEQNAPGCTPCRTDGEVGFLVVFFGVGFGFAGGFFVGAAGALMMGAAVVATAVGVAPSSVVGSAVGSNAGVVAEGEIRPDDTGFGLLQAARLTPIIKARATGTARFHERGIVIPKVWRPWKAI